MAHWSHLTFGLNNKMKIKFLGTSAGWPLSRLGCKCALCASGDPRDTRTRTQLLVNDSILLDAGPDTYRHLTTIDPTTIKAILISHAHLDHTMGFWDLTHIYNGPKPINVYVTLQVLSEIRKYISIHGQNLKINIVKPNQPFLIDQIKVEYFPVIHGKTPAFGIKLKESRIFIYITDFKRILPSQEKTIRHADYWAIDGSTLSKIGQGPGHISIEDGINLARKYKIKNTYFVHIGHKTGTHAFLENHLQQKAGPNFHIAYDNLKITL